MIKAKYTVVLKTLLDSPECRAIIEDALSRYPLYAAEKHYDLLPTREELNKRLLNTYKYREIGFETVGRFVDELEITMDNIMPYYNEMLKTVVTMAELPSPFDNVDVVETFKQTTAGNTKTTSSDRAETTTSGNTTTNSTVTDDTTNSTDMTNADKSVKSTAPQGQLSISAKNIENVDYADEVNWNKNESNSVAISKGESVSNGSSTSSGANTTSGSMESENESTGVVEHTFTKVGNQGVNTYAHDMNEFRTSIIDVVDQIINDHRIQELFMLVY